MKRRVRIQSRRWDATKTRKDAFWGERATNDFFRVFVFSWLISSRGAHEQGCAHHRRQTDRSRGGRGARKMRRGRRSGLRAVANGGRGGCGQGARGGPSRAGAAGGSQL